MLVVDDLEINRRVLSRQLTSWRIEHECVNGAHDALEALRAAAAAGKPFRLALIDHMMPDVDGLTLGRQIASDRELQHTAMVMLSSAGQQNSKRFHEAGFFAVMVKPVVRARQLLNVLQAAMNAAPRTIGEGAATVASAVDRLSRTPAEQFMETTKMTPRRVLLAEDNVVNAKLAVRLLERLGCRVDVASNGHEALKMVQSIPFDIVFMDCQMPEMDGFEATRAIRAWEAASRIGTSPGSRCRSSRSRRMRCRATAIAVSRLAWTTTSRSRWRAPTSRACWKRPSPRQRRLQLQLLRPSRRPY